MTEEVPTLKELGPSDGDMTKVVAFEVTLPVGHPVRDVLSGGVPCRLVGGGYDLLECVDFLTENYVQFASNGIGGRFCVEVTSGRVVEVLDAGLVKLVSVNTSLRHFRESVEAFNARFPFYSIDDDSERWTQVAGELEVVLASIDDASRDFQGFWEDLLSSVTIGDYATELITEGLT